VTGVRPEAFVPVAITERSGFDESIHHGAVVVVDGAGEIVWSAGDPSVVIYPRSSMKPLQCDAMIEQGFTGTPEQIALACASHIGEPRHIDVVRSILADGGLDESALGNTPDWPLDEPSRDAVVAAGDRRRPLFMNCSGKHAAMVVTAARRGWPVDSYLAVDHPLQQAITARVAQLAGDVAHIGIDGCGAPAHALALDGLARAYASIAARRGPIWDAMHHHVELVGGPARPSARLVSQVPDAMAKEGAEGVFAASLPDGPSVAVKIADGSGRAVGVVAAAALARCGVDVDPMPIGDPILGHGRPVGRIRPIVGVE
jgi:L-asparaginase II